MLRVLLGLTLCLALVLFRFYCTIPTKNSQRNTRSPNDTCALAVFLGSGGHTTEALQLLSALKFTRYTPRVYIASRGDTLSAKKAIALELEKGYDASSSSFSVLSIPRARHVHQSLLTTPLSSIQSLAVCIHQITLKPLLSGQPFADVLVLNGPGSCVMLCIATYINKFLGLPAPKLIYIESFARVRRLSLSGKILRRVVDRFVVQWPELAAQDNKTDFRGWLV